MSNRFNGGIISATPPVTTTSKGIWTTTQQMQAAGGGVWPTVPGAPTIGTATSASATSVSVTFTAPSSTGYPTSLTYTVTSSPGGFTATGSSSPLVVTGLTTGTSYTFTVTATNASGTSPSSAASNSVAPLPAGWPGAIGTAYQGGYFAGQVNSGGTIYNLVVSPVSSGQTSTNAGSYSSSTTYSNIDGPTNSATLAGQSRSSAVFCEGLTIGGYSDWYLPALNELQTIYYYAKPTTANNITNRGSNSNAVSPQPVSTNYTLTVPAQSSADVFAGGSQTFSPYIGSGGVGNYWSSTTDSRGYQQGILAVQFGPDGTGGNSGNWGGQYQPTSQGVRAIRRVAV